MRLRRRRMQEEDASGVDDTRCEDHNVKAALQRTSPDCDTVGQVRQFLGKHWQGAGTFMANFSMLALRRSEHGGS